MRTLVCVVLLGLVASCGGGGSNSSTSNPTPPQASGDDYFGGIWAGIVEYPNETFEELLGVTTADGRFVLISADTFGPGTFAQYVGTATIDGTVVSGSGDAFAPIGWAWNDGSPVLSLTISATIDERNTMSGTLSMDGGESVTFELEYDAEYERDSSLQLTEGVWYVYDDLLNPTLTMTIDANGSFSAQNTMGCQSLGQVTIFDGANNIYDWSIEISNCPIAGDYAGLAVMTDIDTGDPATSQDNAILVSIGNNERALLLPLER